jgi:ribosomal-protein-alanine N-acetyltransferase
MIQNVRIKNKIVNMNKNHLQRLAELERVCFSTPWSYTGLYDELKRNDAIFLVALNQENEILGYIGMHFVIDEGYIANLAVFPEYRQRGIARSLVKALTQKSLEKNLSFISLEVRVSNSLAIRLYESENFLVKGRRKNFYSFPSEDAIIMTKMLS